MPWKRMIYLCLAVVAVAVAYFGWRLTARSAYESAKYTVLESDSPFELREYPDLMMATTAMQFASRGDDGSFRRLFQYISGKNENEQKIAMTTPVFMKSGARDDPGQMGFVIPVKVTEQRVPDPSNQDVQLRKRSGGRFAVIRFAGQIDNKSVAEAEQKLREWISERGLIGADESEVAGYDPPWTPGLWRRNELLIRLRSSAQ